MYWQITSSSTGASSLADNPTNDIEVARPPLLDKRPHRLDVVHFEPPFPDPRRTVEQGNLRLTAPFLPTTDAARTMRLDAGNVLLPMRLNPIDTVNVNRVTFVDAHGLVGEGAGDPTMLLENTVLNPALTGYTVVDANTLDLPAGLAPFQVGQRLVLGETLTRARTLQLLAARGVNLQENAANENLTLQEAGTSVVGEMLAQMGFPAGAIAAGTTVTDSPFGYRQVALPADDYTAAELATALEYQMHQQGELTAATTVAWETLAQDTFNFAIAANSGFTRDELYDHIETEMNTLHAAGAYVVNDDGSVSADVAFRFTTLSDELRRLLSTTMPPLPQAYLTTQGAGGAAPTWDDEGLWVSATATANEELQLNVRAPPLRAAGIAGVTVTATEAHRFSVGQPIQVVPGGGADPLLAVVETITDAFEFTIGIATAPVAFVSALQPTSFQFQMDDVSAQMGTMTATANAAGGFQASLPMQLEDTSPWYLVARAPGASSGVEAEHQGTNAVDVAAVLHPYSRTTLGASPWGVMSLVLPLGERVRFQLRDVRGGLYPLRGAHWSATLRISDDHVPFLDMQKRF